MGSQNEHKSGIRPPMQLPASHSVGRHGTPSRPIKGSADQSRQTPEPGHAMAPLASRPAERRFQPPNSQFHRRSFGQAVAEVFTGMQSALQGAQRSRPRRDDYGAPSEAMARANSRPVGFGDDESRAYSSYTDASVEAPASRWDEDSAEYQAQRDPWDRQWADWSDGDDAEDDRYYDDDVYAESSEWESRRHDRTAWGGWPDAGTMASVAVNAVNTGPSSKKRSKGAVAAKPTTGSLKQLLAWAQSGFSQKAMPTRKAINFLVLLCILGTLVLSTAGMAFAGYNDYSSILTGAKAGQTALTQMGEDLGLGKSGKATNTVAAYNDLTQALNDFQMIHERLVHPDFILAIAGDVPLVDKKLQSGVALTTIGVEAMQMMQKIFPAIVSISKVVATSPISTAGDTNTVDPAQLLRATDILNLTQGFNDAKPYIDSMITTLNNTPPDTLVAALNSKQKGEILPFLQFVPQLPNVISFINDFLPLAPTLLGTTGEVGYALTTLDNGEIRPVGGFQGQLALFSVNGGHVSHISLQDIYQIENKNYTHGSSDVPPNVNEAWWNGNGLGYSIRNSGLSPDFPTSARDYLNELHSQPLCKTPLVYPNAGTDQYGCPNARYIYPFDPKAYYPEGNHIPVADPTSGAITGYEPQAVPMVGMIVIQQNVIEQLIQRTGPIQVGCPYNVSVTPANLQQLIHYYQETDQGNKVGTAACAGGASSASKRFSSIVATTLLNKIKTISKADLVGFVGDVLQDFKTRDIQVYFADPTKANYAPLSAGETFLAKYSATSTVYTGTGDSLLVNQANIAGDKLDNYLALKLVDNITIGRDHSATHDLTINYVYNIPNITVNPADAKYQAPWGQLQAWQVDVYNTIFNASYSPDYVEFRRVYVAPHAEYLTGTGLLGCSGGACDYNAGSFPSYTTSDVSNRAVFGAFYDYRVESPDGSTIHWFAPDQIPNPTMSWKVPSITQNGTYSLMLQRQSGMTTNVDITIACANGKTLTHVTQTITVDTPISTSTAGC